MGNEGLDQSRRRLEVIGNEDKERIGATSLLSPEAICRMGVEVGVGCTG